VASHEAIHHAFGMTTPRVPRGRLARVPTRSATAPVHHAAPAVGRGELSGLFWSAFRNSRNAMALVDHDRILVDVNGAFVQLTGRTPTQVLGRPVAVLVVGAPRFTPAAWRAALASGKFTGDNQLLHADGTIVAVQWDASTEVVTGRQLVLFVALSTSRWGARFSAEGRDAGDPGHGDPQRRGRRHVPARSVDPSGAGRRPAR